MSLRYSLLWSPMDVAVYRGMKGRCSAGHECNPPSSISTPPCLFSQKHANKSLVRDGGGSPVRPPLLALDHLSDAATRHQVHIYVALISLAGFIYIRQIHVAHISARFIYICVTHAYVASPDSYLCGRQYSGRISRGSLGPPGQKSRVAHLEARVELLAS